MADQSLKLTIECDASGAITSINQVTKAEEDLTKANESTGLSFTELNQALELGRKAWDLLSGAAKTAIGAISEGSAIGDVTEAFGKMSNKAGELSSVLVDQLRKATGGTINDLDLMRSTIEATRAGAKPDEFVKLAEASRVLAEETGGNLTDELNVLSNAFETGQVRMLKNRLGVIDVEKAENDLAKQLGVTRDNLSKEGQVLAARTAILDAAAKHTQAFGKVTDDSGDAINKMGAAITNAYNKVKLAIGTNDELNKALQSLANQISHIDFAPIVNGISSVITIATKGVNALITLGGAIAQLFTAVPASGQTHGMTEQEIGEALTAAVTKTKELQTETLKANDALTTIGSNPAVSNLNSSLVDTTKMASDAADAIKEIEEAIRGTEMLGPGNFEGQMQASSEQAQRNVSSILFGTPDDKQRAQIIASGIQEAIGQAITAITQGGSGRDIAGGLGGTAGGALGAYFGGPIGAQIGAAIGNSLGKGISDGIDHIFGGNSDPENKARDSVAEFFKRVFDSDRIRVVVDDQLQILEKLDFAKFTGDDSAIFQPLLDSTAQVQDGFNGIGLALQEQLGITEDIAGQIAATLFNNVGGSLNDLQLLIGETGLSLEDLKVGIIDAFKSGEVTATDALNALHGVENVMQQGIPDGVGMVGEAFENLKKGGINSLDALGDLAIELQEKQVPGVTATLEDLRKELLAQGKPIEEVDGLMQAFTQNGIDSLDDLKTASEETGIAIISSLQQSATDFGEALSKTADDIKSLRDNLNELDGKQVDIDVRYHVSTTGDEVPSGAPGVGT